MARVRKSHKSREENVKSSGKGLQPPYRTSHPGANPYVVYADNKDRGKMLILSFGERYSAHWFLTQLIEGDSWEKTHNIGNRQCIVTESGLRISMFGDNVLYDLINYEPTELEAEWVDDQVLRQVARLKHGKAEDLAFPTAEDLAEPRQKKERVKREKKEPKPKIDKTGLISANDIARELGVEGREVRGVLRAMKLEKPAGGWLFDKKTADDIREKVKKGLKGKK